MRQRVRLLVFSDFIQATIVKVIGENEKDVIKVTVYGYTPDEKAHIQFSYDVPYKNEENRDKAFEEITPEKMFEDILKIIEASDIPIKF